MSDIESKRFGAHLKKLRKEKKLTLRELAVISGTSDSYLSQLETNKRNPPKPDLLKKIAQSLGETPNEKAIYYHQLMYEAGYELSEEVIVDSAKESIRGNTAIEFAEMISNDTGMIIGKEIIQFYLNNKDEKDTLDLLFLLLSRLNNYNQLENQNERIELSLDIRSSLEYLLLNLQKR